MGEPLVSSPCLPRARGWGRDLRVYSCLLRQILRLGYVLPG